MLCPFVWDEDGNIVLKTVYPSRKLERRYGKRQNQKPRLTRYERRIEESLEAYAPASEAEKKHILQAAAKTKTISLRINETVLESIKRKAADEGLPYQTLISSVLFKFSSNRLIDEIAIRKAVEALK